jgi:hypothetical protein
VQHACANHLHFDAPSLQATYGYGECKYARLWGHSKKSADNFLMMATRSSEQIVGELIVHPSLNCKLFDGGAS